MKYLLLLIFWVSLTLQMGTLAARPPAKVIDRGIITSIANMPGVAGILHANQPDKKLDGLFAQLGVDRAGFVQALDNLGEIYPSLLRWPPINDITHASLLEDITYHEDMREIFASFLLNPQEMLAKTSQRLALWQQISQHVGNKHDTNGVLAQKIGIDWNKFLQLATSDEAELADFVYLRYTVGQNSDLDALFNKLLAAYNLSRDDFDAFFTANKQHYADLTQRKDIIDRLIRKVLPQRQDVIDGILYYANTTLLPTHPETKLKELLALLGVKRDDFVQALAEFGKIYPSRFTWPPIDDIAHASLLKDIAYDREERKLFASFLPSQEKLKKNSPQLVLWQQILQHASNTNTMQANDIEPIWDKFLQLTTNDEVELADFAYLRYVVGENSNLDALFNKLLAKHNLSRDHFDMFFAAQKRGYVDLTQHKDIIDGILAALLISANNLMRERLFRSIGIDEETYTQYAHRGGGITHYLIDIQAAIGDDKELNAIFTELLAEQGITREEFEQAISDVTDVYKDWWPVLVDLPAFQSSSLAIEREEVLKVITSQHHHHHYYDEAHYFYDLITKTGGRASPAKAKRRSTILKEMSDIASTTSAWATAMSDSEKTGKGSVELDLTEAEHTKRGLMKLGLNTNAQFVIDFITANEQYPYKDEEHSYPYLDVFIIMHFAVSQNTRLQTQLNKTPLSPPTSFDLHPLARLQTQLNKTPLSPRLKEMNTQLQTLFIKLLAEYGWSKDKFETFLADNSEREIELSPSLLTVSYGLVLEESQELGW